MGRAPCCDKANVKKGPWSPEEDATLKDYIEKHGTGGNWIALPQKIGIKRCGKSCRLRWLNYLRPNIKHGGFTEEEDNIICSLYISIGSRWSIIAAQLPGRTDNDIKNYWNTRLKKKLLGRRKQSRMNRMSSSLFSENEQGIGNNNDQEEEEEENPFLQNLSSSALERLQLHMQLQNLQNPLSNFYTNPSLWPNFHNLLQEKMLENIPTMQKIPSPIILPNHHVQLLENSANGTLLSSSSSSRANDLMYDGVVKDNGTNNVSEKVNVDSGIQTLMKQVDHSEGVGIETLENQMAEFDSCLKQMDEGNNSREGITWWSSNDIIESNSTSSNSWESASFLLQSDEMYHDSTLWYNNM